MEPTRQAARQLAQQGVIHITQKGQVRPLNKPHACNSCITAVRQQGAQHAAAEALKATAGTAVYQGCTAEAPQQQPHDGRLHVPSCLQVVDPNNFKGPIRLRLADTAAGTSAQPGIAAFLQPAATAAAVQKST